MNEHCTRCDIELEEDQTGLCDDCQQPAHNPNVSAVVELMEFSKFGPLAQVFVIDALLKQAQKVAAMDPATAKCENPMLSFDAWHGVAKEIAAKLNAHLAGPL